MPDERSSVPRAFVTLHDLWIQTKTSQFVRLGDVINEVQAGILDDIYPGWRDGGGKLRRGVRNYELKARQFGVSTIYLAIYFLDTVNTPDTESAIIADDASNTAKLFDKARIFWEYLPENKRPAKRFSTKTELEFEGRRSAIRVLTAGARTSGRSRTIHNLHCSEMAFWPDALQVLTGLLQAVPGRGNVTIESTANGQGTVDRDGNPAGGRGALFHIEWQRAERNENGYQARFTPWYAHKEYSLPPPPGFMPTAEEAQLAHRFKLSLGQLAWRRAKRAEPGMGTLFVQEYPATAEEAFRAAGSRFYSHWDEERHVVPAHRVPTTWVFAGGYDWGTASPASFHLGAWNPATDECHIVDEWYQAGRSTRDHAKEILAVLKRWGLDPRFVPIYGDPSIFPPQNSEDWVERTRVEDLWDAGLNVVRATNRRHDTHDNANRYMAEGKLFVHRTCSNLIRTVPLMVRAEKDPEDFEQGGAEDHAIDSGLRYLLSSRPLPVEGGQGQRPPQKVLVPAGPAFGKDSVPWELQSDDDDGRSGW